MQFIRKASKILVLQDGRQLACVKLIQQTEKELVNKKLSGLQRQESEDQSRVRTDSMTSRFSTTHIAHE
ncbi:hypothetical protein BLA29_014403, partial [Euroglyphus maynei]